MDEVISGFHKTVFGLEYRSWNWRSYRVKKFSKPVRAIIYNLAEEDRSDVVARFVNTIDRKVRGLDMATTFYPEDANFRIYIIDRHQYEDLVREVVLEDEDADVPGKCLVRVAAGKKSIEWAIAVIVADEGEHLFRRCMTEEILQGLGPMNDDDDLPHSVFNDTTRHSSFTRFDRILLNMLYDPTIKHGMSQRKLEPFLPLIARRAWKTVTLEDPPSSSSGQ